MCVDMPNLGRMTVRPKDHRFGEVKQLPEGRTRPTVTQA
jgi:hypothetical protein